MIRIDRVMFKFGFDASGSDSLYSGEECGDGRRLQSQSQYRLDYFCFLKSVVLSSAEVILMGFVTEPCTTIRGVWRRWLFSVDSIKRLEICVSLLSHLEKIRSMNQIAAW